MSVLGCGSTRSAMRLTAGTPVRLCDGREGYVQDVELQRVARSDDPAAPDITTRVTHYSVRLTAGRGTVAVTPAKLRIIGGMPRPAGITPKGAV